MDIEWQKSRMVNKIYTITKRVKQSSVFTYMTSLISFRYEPCDKAFSIYPCILLQNQQT